MTAGIGDGGDGRGDHGVRGDRGDLGAGDGGDPGVRGGRDHGFRGFLSAFAGATWHLWAMLAVTGAGWAAGEALDATTLSSSEGYLLFTAVLLSVGLYSSTFGIDLAEVRQDLRLLAAVVTVGVLAKTALIGLVLWAALDDPAYVVLAVVMAQIDPLSVAALSGRSRLSARGRSILSVWASFDDPMTVLLTAYTAPLALMMLDGRQPAGQGTASDDLASYAAQLGGNAALVAGAGVVWSALAYLAKRGRGGKERGAVPRPRGEAGGESGAGRRWTRRPTPRRTHHRVREGVALLALAGIVFIAGTYTLMLAVAVIGLFFRPVMAGRHLDTVARAAYLIAAFTLGLLLVHGVEIRNGLILGAAAYAAQVVVGGVLTRRLGRVDRISLALSQQNGITAIILALSLAPMFPRAVAIVAPAILTVNCLHVVANQIWALRPGVDRSGTPVPG